ncbi:MAG: hypothetical protein K2W97_07695, partial [Chthoniobacterales bacterium]|nr:hypothetical protein [Chthoniobacterales bacterium]
MKRRSPSSFFVIQVAVLLLSLTFLSSSFAVRPKLVGTKGFGVWNIGDSDTKGELGDTREITADNRARFDQLSDNGSDRSSLEQRRSNIDSVQKDEFLFLQQKSSFRAKEDQR